MVATASLAGAAVTAGLTAGLLYAFAQAVMPGLSRTDDRTFVGAFRAMDRAILSPLFLAIFLGAPGLTALAVVLHLGRPSLLAWTLAALGLSLATVIITRVVHLPLNAALQAAGGPHADPAAARHRFERRWVRWNLVRTVTSTGSFACLVVALAS